MIQHFQPISVFKKDPYKKILSFPKVKDSEIKKRIVELKKLFSSSMLTALQTNAPKKQKWPFPGDGVDFLNILMI